ncbi:ABC transporter ATP-binding protein [Marinobacter nanhaiticus D15-8W]|uniref:sn-glycerol-3-phosphate ABC transporter ATP-binding protein UgpC n=1 Tax=Marinobacter nanhaiticus D15-8W TaxID=626887 RepID=N6W9K1_9GAMM|nr:sn-glycerol-3-phosphate ABC transporter ATP-binding protein UgpC [Marinobacter nanhaiticus]ENO16964.1 sn-glycerol-3-phosphate ABC transporter ATP-binding protein UgpC [Marinobacter nanhaiticus D15-8W]BES72041.1 ABC transporter ATP-binding protein [Marinobacter nanhaiticus D15-8W]
MAQLQLKGIRKTYGKSVQETLKGIDIHIESGEFLILVGPSGCGKSTLMNSIAGLEHVTEGNIFIDGKDVTHAEPKDRDIAMVFQSYALYPTMTVRENIAFGLKIRRMPKDEIDTEVQRVATLLQIENLLDRKPSQLSGGQQQRVAMGRALARRPKIYLFDEPLSNLDAKLRVEMRTEIKRLHQRLGTTIVYVTHDQIEAMTLADRIAVIKDGELLQLGTPKEIYERPATRYVASFIGSPAMSFIPLKVEGEPEAPRARLRSADGDETFVPLPKKLAEYHGREIHLGIRPEHITQPLAHKEGQTAIASGTFRIEVTEPTGPDVIALTRINDTDVHCRLDPDHTVEPGQPAQLMVDLSRAVYFESGQEARIEI